MSEGSGCSGRPHVTIADDQFLLQHPEVDVVVKGEGEETIVELAKYVAGVKSLSDIAGIAFNSKEQVVHTANRPCIQNLDELPYPAYHYFPTD